MSNFKNVFGSTIILLSCCGSAIAVTKANSDWQTPMPENFYHKATIQGSDAERFIAIQKRACLSLATTLSSEQFECSHPITAVVDKKCEFTGYDCDIVVRGDEAEAIFAMMVHLGARQDASFRTGQVAVAGYNLTCDTSATECTFYYQMP